MHGHLNVKHPFLSNLYILIVSLYVSAYSNVNLNFAVLNKIATLQTESYFLALGMFELCSACTPTLHLCNILLAIYATAWQIVLHVQYLHFRCNISVALSS